MLENIFWSLYATCYDTVAKLAPYQKMLHDISSPVLQNNSENILDVGCGTGNLRTVIRQQNSTCKYTGVDQSPQMLLRARKKSRSDPRTQLTRHDINRPLPFEHHAFDAVICSNVLYIVENPEAVADDLKKLVKRGGILLVSTPHEQAGMMAHLQAHIHEKGALSLVPIFIPLLLVGLFNLLICRNGSRGKYHFLSREAVEHLFPGARIERTFADQNWLITYRPPEA